MSSSSGRVQPAPGGCMGCGPRSDDQIETARREFPLAAAFAREHWHHLLGEDLHLLLDLLGAEAAELEPAEEAEIVVAAFVAHLHDRVDDVLLGAVDGDFPVAQHLRRYFFVEVEHRLVEPRHYGAEPEGSVIVELQLDRPRRTAERLLLPAGASDVEVAA